MGDSKATPLLGGLALLLLLPMIIVAAMLFTAMGAIGQENPCEATQAQGKAFVWPTDEHGDPAEGFDNEGAEKHEGIDYDADKGSPVRAAERGKVVSTDGEWIKIEHAEGRVQTWYRFFESKSVAVGDEVTRGQEIGKVGEGDEDEPGEDGAHLHFELRIKDGGNWVAKDPTDEIGDDATESGACACGGPLVGGNNQEKAFNFFVSNGYSKEQAAGIVGNMIHESSVEPARLQGTSPGTITHPSDAINSELGWGIVQWTPAGKMIRPSMTATDNDEAKVESLEWQLEFLRKQLEGEGPVPEGNAGTQLKATSTPEDAAVAFGRYYERFAGSDNLNHERYTQRKTAARQVFQTFGGGGEGAAPGGCGAGNGDIAATAKMLAWDTPGHGKNREDAKTEPAPGYAKAMDEYNGATTDDPYSDCGVFVATVMHMSGADPEYPKRSTGVQEDYLRNSGKYDVYDDITVDQLKPGDILIGPGHTYLFVGEFNGYNSAAGSLHDHVPEAGHAYGIGSQFAAARLKNPPQPQGE